MYAIINNGNGDYYTSTVYACYEDPTNEDGTNWWGEYYIVLNKEKNALIKHYAYDSSVKPSIRQMILYIDDNQDNWNVDKRTGIGEVNISDRDSLMKMVEQSTVSNELIELDKQYHFEDYPEIHNEADIAFVSFLEIPAASATLSTNALLLITSAMFNYLQPLIVRTI